MRMIDELSKYAPMIDFCPTIDALSVADIVLYCLSFQVPALRVFEYYLPQELYLRGKTQLTQAKHMVANSTKA